MLFGFRELDALSLPAVVKQRVRLGNMAGKMELGGDRVGAWYTSVDLLVNLLDQPCGVKNFWPSSSLDGLE